MCFMIKKKIQVAAFAHNWSKQLELEKDLKMAKTHSAVIYFEIQGWCCRIKNSEF